MTVTTIYATAPGGNGNVVCISATYSTARTGGGSKFGQANHIVGQGFDGSTYGCYESFLIFDTSSIPDGDSVSAVTLSLDGSIDTSTTNFTARVAASSYDGGAVVTTDYVSGASLPTPVLATWASSGYSSSYNAFTENSGFKNAINKTGNTSLIIYSDRHAGNNTPTNEEFVTFLDADASGTSTDPKLDITHTTPPAAIHLPYRGSRRFFRRQF